MVQNPATKCCMKPSCNACSQTLTPQTYTPDLQCMLLSNKAVYWVLTQKIPPRASCCWVPSCLIPLKQTIGIVVAPEPTGTIAGCIYKGMLVYQGQIIDDGYDYSSECLDNTDEIKDLSKL
ncbi:uncharacterized protein LOC128548711 [Mercenaria mercenaria]|uniref:uncharacterized protein LOC128548711 n=1 Tax=Mercenaria mercenaria TaxID=6596 RepID=UPI00234E4570|nr:uncharacterized protein LOC128548711 [Mercenaria mercenaria]